MEYIIGRESGAAAPRLCIKQGEKSFFFGSPGSVPKSVSRSHCRLTVAGDGKMTVNNVSDQNSLFVNGLEYKSKTITKEDLIELGADRYRLELPSILALLNQGDNAPKSKAEPQTYHLAHLKTIWGTYSDTKLKNQIRERNFNALSSIPGVISMVSIGLSFIPGLRAVFITIAAAFAIAFVLIRMDKAKKTPLQQKALEEKFQDDYVCPHCKRFLGYQRYDLVLRNGECPKCRSKFVE